MKGKSMNGTYIDEAVNVSKKAEKALKNITMNDDVITLEGLTYVYRDSQDKLVGFSSMPQYRKLTFIEKYGVYIMAYAFGVVTGLYPVIIRMLI